MILITIVRPKNTGVLLRERFQIHFLALIQSNPLSFGGSEEEELPGGSPFLLYQN